MLFDRFRIRSKLTLLVIIPLLGVVALTVPIMINRIDAARDAQDVQDLVDLSTEVGSTLQQLDDERLLTVGFLLKQVSSDELVAKSAQVRDRLVALDKREGAPAALHSAVASAARLNKTRSDVLAGRAQPAKVLEDYYAISTQLIDSLELRRRADLSTTAGRSLFALDRAIRTDDLVNLTACYLSGAAIAGLPDLAVLYFTALVVVQSGVVSDQQFFTPAQYQLYMAAYNAWISRVGTKFINQSLTDPAGALKSLDKDTIFNSLRSVNTLGGFVQKRIATDVLAGATENQDSAVRGALLIGGGAVVLLLVVLLLSIGMSRAVARPLLRLTRSADRVARAAETELERVADDEAETARPIRLDPVDVQARDEIGDLARAFDRVQTTAVRLVERQVAGRRNVAQMFGHVGRRTQNLVSRQLTLIDDLERREADSNRLRELYHLDHMSSRLRRNASSLVVLSGGTGADEHMAPLPLNDVVRLALGEIEDYTRVDIKAPEEIVVVPSLVGDLTLMLAELMENATSYSPPHTRVAVTATELRGGTRVSIIDHGLGLTPERLAEENARLTRRERLDLAPTEVLGLFVVGRLARRHGIEVSLTHSPEGGITAVLDLRPEHLLGRADTVLGQPIQATVNGSQSEYGSLVAGGAARRAPGSAQPFEAHMLARATKTLQTAQSWNAFNPPAAEVPFQEAEIVDDIPRRLRGMGGPVAGRRPEPMHELVPVARVEPIQQPRRTPERAGDDDSRRPHRNGARRRVPGSEFPADAETGARSPSAEGEPAARKADAFAADVARSDWDPAGPETNSGARPGKRSLDRRVPGATLRAAGPVVDRPPAAPSEPLDPDAARALVEQFEFGVERALNETQNQAEGQSR